MFFSSEEKEWHAKAAELSKESFELSDIAALLYKAYQYVTRVPCDILTEKEQVERDELTEKLYEKNRELIQKSIDLLKESSVVRKKARTSVRARYDALQRAKIPPPLSPPPLSVKTENNKTDTNTTPSAFFPSNPCQPPSSSTEEPNDKFDSLDVNLC